MRHAVAVAVVFLVAVASLSAATFEPITDAALVQRADLVVVAHVLDSASRVRADGVIVTDYRLAIEDVLKGTAGSTLVVTEVGGTANGIIMAIPGSAEYTPGSRVVAFLRRGADGSLFTASMTLGAFVVERRPDGVEIAVRSEEGAAVDDAVAFAPRRAGSFRRFIRDVARGIETEPVATIAAPRMVASNSVLNIPADQYALKVGSPSLPVRWQQCGVNADGCFLPYVWNGDQGPSLNESNAVSAGVAAWSGSLGSQGWHMQMANANQDFSKSTAQNFDGDPSVLFANPVSSTPNIGSCTDNGAIACGIVWAATGNTHTYDGKTWYSALDGDVVVRPQTGWSQTQLEAIVAHELGHTIGLRHSDQGTPSSSSALMNSSVPMGSGASLRQWDKDAMTEIYGAGIECVPPESVNVCCAAKVTPGTTKTLTANVTGGNSTLVYQWFRGSSGNEQSPVGINDRKFTTPAINEPMSFWVKVTGECGTALQSAAVIVEPTTCSLPTIVTQPQSQNLATGSSATLMVEANGSTPLTYQWFEGPLGDQSKPVGTNGPTFTSPALTTSTSYWVRITNACGTATSALATITVGEACVLPTIASLTPSQNVALGNGVQLSVIPAGTGPFTYQWYRGDSPSTATPIAGATGQLFDTGFLNTPGVEKYWVQVTGACGVVNSVTISLNVLCGAANTPEISSPAASHVTLGYDVTWTGNPGQASRFEFQEARDENFTVGLRTFEVNGTMTARVSPHTDVTTDTRFYYRVRAFSNCSNEPTPFSVPTSTIVTRPLSETSTEFAITVPQDATQPFRQAYLVPGFGDVATNNDTFAITTDVPWLTVFPQGGALSAGGTTVELTVNPALVDIGTTTGTVLVTRTQGASKGITSNGTTTTTSIPFSVSKVTPVTPAPRSPNPPEGTLIIPAVAHADGIGTRFQSDVRITNTSNDPITYDISFTPSGVNGTQASKRTTLTIPANDTKAFDDIVKAWYGAGVLGELGIGTIEIRPGSANPFATFAASRTYAVETRGTYGQFIPAIRTHSFIGPLVENAAAKLSLQQVANNPSYRTNLGFVEGSGTNVTLLVKLIGGNGALLQQATQTLPPYGHAQVGFAQLFGNTQVDDGRVEVSVSGGTGKATAYASVLDNRTKDPLLVFPVQANTLSARRYVVPGVAELENGVASNFHTDMRLFNAGSAPVVVTLNYYPQRGDATPRPAAVQRTIAAGQVLAIDGVLPTLWRLARTGGSVTVDTPNDSSVIVTARTYSRDAANGTYGQFIPGVTASDAVFTGDRALELLQLEQSEQYRTNLGLVEVTGSPATIQITAYKPDTKTSVVTEATLGPNEFVQFGRIFASMGLPTVYNGRISVRTTAGSGAVAAYGSVVDNRTVDPTYVPSQ